MSTAMRSYREPYRVGQVLSNVQIKRDVLPHAVPFLIHQAKLQVPCLC
jgi:hypothetical protein